MKSGSERSLPVRREPPILPTVMPMDLVRQHVARVTTLITSPYTGLELAKTNIPAHFTIVAKNYFDEELPVGGDAFEVVISGPAGSISPKSLEVRSIRIKWLMLILNLESRITTTVNMKLSTRYLSLAPILSISSCGRSTSRTLLTLFPLMAPMLDHRLLRV